jgi:6-phosphofructokinase
MLLPTGRGSRGTDFRLRAIASRKYGRYGRLHERRCEHQQQPQAGERHTLPGLILGYSQPLGYPRRFDRTLVAQLGVRAAPTNGNSALVNVGVGIRQQVTPRSVFDVGLKSDIAGGAETENFRLIAGYSSAFKTMNTKTLWLAGRC